MSHQAIVEDRVFEKQDFVEEALPKTTYEGCKFVQCNFADAVLENITFIDCVFDGCNLSMANVQQTSFRDVQFLHCKMLGLHFETCNTFLFAASFAHCLLNHSSFYGLKMVKASWVDCSLQGVDFTDAILTAAKFEQCNCANAIFSNTQLEKANFLTAYDYTIDPARNKIKKAKFGWQGLSGLLAQWDIVVQ